MASNPILQPSWYRLHDETQKAYAAFELYRDMGEERSHAKLAAELGMRNFKTIEKWSKRFQWVQRTTEFDRELQLAHNRNFHKARLAAIERQALLGQKMQEKALEGLDSKDLELDANSIARLADVGVKVERLAYGDTTDNEQTDTRITFQLAELPPWAKKSVDNAAEQEQSRSIPASPYARSLTAKTINQLEEGA